MKEENWTRVEACLCDIDTTLNDLDNDDIEVSAAMSDIRRLADEVYTVCEDDYCDSCDNAIPPGYEEIIDMLPDTKLSLAEMLSLKETIQKWRDTYGYPNP